MINPINIWQSPCFILTVSRHNDESKNTWQFPCFTLTVARHIENYSGFLLAKNTSIQRYKNPQKRSGGTSSNPPLILFISLGNWRSLVQKQAQPLVFPFWGECHLALFSAIISPFYSPHFTVIIFAFFAIFMSPVSLFSDGETIWISFLQLWVL